MSATASYSAYQADVLALLRQSNVEDCGLEVFLGGLSGVGPVDAAEVWRYITEHVLRPEHPFELHLELAKAVFAAWPTDALGRAPLWAPNRAQEQDTNVARFLAMYQGDGLWRRARTGRPSQDWYLLQRLSWEQPHLVWPALLMHLRINFAQLPSGTLELNQDPDKVVWLPGCRINAAAAALTCPRAQGPDSPAVVWAAEGAPRVLHTLSLRQLRLAVDALAARIAARFAPGDAIALVLPMTAAAVALYLAVVLAGCVVVSVADSFAPGEIEARLRISKAKAVFTQDVVLRGGKALPLYRKVLDAHAPMSVVLPAGTDILSCLETSLGKPGPTSSAGGSGAPPLGVELRPGDNTWQAFLAWPTRGSNSSDGGGSAAFGSAAPAVFEPYVPPAGQCGSTPTNILFSSGTTGEPKAIPWTHLTPLRAAVDAWAHQDVRPGNVVAWPTSLGWMMGPWLVYAALLNGAALALYEGSPLGRDYGEFMEASRVNVSGLVPSIVKAWRASGCMKGLDLSSIRCWASTGEASSPEDYAWLMALTVQCGGTGYRPVVEYCGGTEIGGAYISSTLVHPNAPSAFTTPTLGAHLLLLPSASSAAASEDQADLLGGACAWSTAAARCNGGGSSSTSTSGGNLSGELALVPPMLGISQHRMNKDHDKVYYDVMPRWLPSGLPLRRHGDELMSLMPTHTNSSIAAGGLGPLQYCALGRCDDTMNLGGIKVSSVELEQAVMEGVKQQQVAEAAAVGVPTPGGGPERLVLFVVLHKNSSSAGSGGTVSREDVAALQAACQSAISTRLNPLFKVAMVVVRDALPRTASNKVMRRVLRDEIIAAAAAASATRPASKL